MCGFNYNMRIFHPRENTRGNSRNLIGIYNALYGLVRNHARLGPFNNGDIVWNCGDSALTRWRYDGEKWNGFDFFRNPIQLGHDHLVIIARKTSALGSI